MSKKNVSDKQKRQETLLSKEIQSDEVKKLISLGEEKGFLTYDDVNEMLPSDIVSSDQIDEIIMLFGEKNIDIIDTDKGKRSSSRKRSMKPPRSRKKRKTSCWPCCPAPPGRGTR